jgi:hypothetical protein
MNGVLKKQIQDCIDSLIHYQPKDNSDPECWVRWYNCVSQFQESEYLKALETSLTLLKELFIPKLFPIVQITLLCLDQTEEDTDRDYWGSKLLEIVPLSSWQQSLASIILNKIDFQTVIFEATDNEKKCQVYYYMGESLINIGNLKEALLFFERSTSFGGNCIEHQFAKKRIEFFNNQESSCKLAKSIFYTHQIRNVPVVSTKYEYDLWMKKGSGEKLLSSVFQLLKGNNSQNIALLADQHRLNTWSRVVQRVGSYQSEIDQSTLDPDSAWLPPKIRFIIADAYKEVFIEQIKSVSLVQDYSCAEDFLLIKGSDLLPYSKLQNYRDIKNLLKSNKEIDPTSEKYFVSHRWFSSDQPDPSGIILSLLKKYIQPEAYYWIDYTCMPQKPRTEEEHKLFREHLKWLPSLFFNLNIIIIRCLDDGYFSRAWCFFEILAANVVGRQISYIYEDETMFENNQNNERKVLEQTLLNMDLPESMATTELDDKEIIQVLVQNVAFLFKLRVVEHYLALGQEISNQCLFFCEDPYYFIATCDFSKVILWLFDKSKELNMQLIDLTLDYSSKNFLLKISQYEHFKSEGANSFEMSKKVALDESRLLWFKDNKFREDSASNLFYKLTAMIE